jgi:hypothetical protein
MFFRYTVCLCSDPLRGCLVLRYSVVILGASLVIHSLRLLLMVDGTLLVLDEYPILSILIRGISRMVLFRLRTSAPAKS